MKPEQRSPQKAPGLDFGDPDIPTDATLTPDAPTALTAIDDLDDVSELPRERSPVAHEVQSAPKFVNGITETDTKTSSPRPDYATMIARWKAEKKARHKKNPVTRGLNARRQRKHRATQKAQQQRLCNALRSRTTRPKGDKATVKRLERLRGSEIKLTHFYVVLEYAKRRLGPKVSDAKLADIFRQASKRPCDRNQAFRLRKIVEHLTAKGGPWEKLPPPASP
jgi:hypothetical protein